MIDDTKDADTDEYKKQSEKQSQKAEPDYANETITARAAKDLKDIVEQNGFTVDQVLCPVHSKGGGVVADNV